MGVRVVSRNGATLGFVGKMPHYLTQISLLPFAPLSTTTAAAINLWATTHRSYCGARFKATTYN